MSNEKENSGSSPVGRFLNFLRYSGSSHTRSLFFFSVLVNLALLGPSFHMMQVYDRVLSSGSGATLFSITAIILFVLCVYAVGETVRGRVAQRLSAVYSVGVSRKLFAKLGDPAAIDKSGGYLRDFSSVRQFLASKTFIALFDLPFIPFYVFLLIFVHPTVALLTVIGFVAMVGAGYLNFKLTQKSRGENIQVESEAAGFAHTVFTRSGEVRAFGMVPHLLNDWGGRMAATLKTGEEATSVSSALYAFTRAVRQSIQVATMAWGAWLVLQGDMSGGMIFLASMISGRALAPLEQLIGGWETIQRSLESFNNVELLTGPDKKLQRRPDLPEPTGKLQIHDIVFRGYGKKPVLAGASMELIPGKAVVIHGDTGAGKSMLMSIMAGAREPEGGHLVMDGSPRQAWPQHQWGRNMGYCPEESGFLVGTIAQNISRFDPEADLEEVYRVAKLIGAHEKITELPQGYQTQISNGTDIMSASLKKQISLARAFYGNPRVLILDRPTNLLDRRITGLLANAIAQAKRDQVAVAMTTEAPILMHLADGVVEIKNGRLVAGEMKSPTTNEQPRAALKPVQSGTRTPQQVANAQLDRLEKSVAGKPELSEGA